MIGAEVRPPRGEFCFSEPELADGLNACQLKTILPNIVIKIAAVVASTADAAAGNDALHEKVERARAKGAGAARQDCVFTKISGHVVTILFPLIPIAGSGDGRVRSPHGWICWRAAGRDLGKERRNSKGGYCCGNEQSCCSGDQWRGELHWSPLIPFSGASGAGRRICLREQLGLDTNEKRRCLLFGADIIGVNTALLRWRKDSLFE